MPAVKVFTAKYETVPKSASVSISAKATPATIPVRAKGNDAPKSLKRSAITTREQEILRWIYLGKSNFEIGTILNISPLTVKNHVQKILRKLNVVNRAQAVGKALDLRLLSP